MADELLGNYASFCRYTGLENHCRWVQKTTLVAQVQCQFNISLSGIERYDGTYSMFHLPVISAAMPLFPPPLATLVLFVSPHWGVPRLPPQPDLQPARRLLHCALFLLVWGEAANLRFMPECLAYIFHRVSAGGHRNRTQ